MLNPYHKDHENAVPSSLDLFDIVVYFLKHYFQHHNQLLSLYEHGGIVLPPLDRYIFVYHFIFASNHAILLKKALVFTLKMFLIYHCLPMLSESITLSFLYYFPCLGHVIWIKS